MNFKISTCSLVIVIFTISCGLEEDESHNSPSVWRGNESGFEDEFDYEKGVDGSSKPILVESETGNSYSGTLEINSSGQVTTKSYQDGVLDGISVKRSKDGSWVEANYLNGQLHGKMTFYDAKGKIRTVMDYENGKLKTVD